MIAVPPIPALFLIAALMVSCPRELAAEPVTLEVTPIPLDTAQPERIAVGSLIYRGGLHLSSDHPSFGGLSALGSSADGSLLLAVTDRGSWLELHPEYDKEGRLTGITGADLSPMTDTNGEVMFSKFASDAESLSPGANGAVIVSFERQHRMLMYPQDELTPTPIPTPEGLGDAPVNGGIEALTLLADGRLLAITQSMGTGDQRVGWISNQSGWSPLLYTASDGYDPTGATTLPGGDVLILERLYGLRGGNRVRIRRIPEHTIDPGADLQGMLVAELKAPLSVDNMEGIAVRPTSPEPGSGGNAIVYLVSDDNFNPDEQRTLLMMFELKD